MRSKIIILIFILGIFAVSSCQGKSMPGQTVSFQIAPAKTEVPFSTAPVYPSEPETEIVKQIEQIASAYNQLVEDEKNTGNFEEVLLEDGTKGINFTETSYIKIFNEYILVQEKIEKLNEDFFELRMQGAQPMPTPNFLTQENQQVLLTRSLEEYQIWLSNELIQGKIISIYSPDELKYFHLLIGESYVEMRKRENAINAIRIYSHNIPREQIDLDIQHIQSIEPGSMVSLVDIAIFPYYRNDLNLTTYETQTRFYVFYTPVHQIVEINLKQMPSGNTALPVSQLESLARGLILKFSPSVNLDNLTPVTNSKIGTYFFRWEDRNGLLLDDGMTYPFIQVGLNGNGELLNYYNALPVARQK